MAHHRADPSLFINRELSWLEFNARVLAEAYDERTPLLERLKFLAIFHSNLDEFYMVRVAGLRRQMSARVPHVSNDGLTARRQLELIDRRVREMTESVQHCLHEVLLPALAARGGRIILISDREGLHEAGLKPLAGIELPKMNPRFAPIVYSVPVQLLAYHAAVALGKDVDQPRNLAKSVTVE